MIDGIIIVVFLIAYGWIAYHIGYVDGREDTAVKAKVSETPDTDPRED